MHQVKLYDEFKTFVSRGNVIDLAVGIIIGAAFTAIVNSLVSDIIMPPIGLLTGKVDFANKFFLLAGNGPFATLADAQKAGAVTINYGLFINAVIKFLIVSFVVFLLVKEINKLKAHGEAAEKAEEAKAPEPTKSEALLIEIRDLLKK